MILNFDLVTPAIGLVFWTSIVFVILLVLLAKFAWKPILGAVKQREENIDNALKSAEKAKEELTNLQAKNEDLLKEAREERDQLIKDAKEARERMIEEAKAKANEEAERIMTDARETIQHEKNAAMTELKNTVGVLALEIAEQVIREQLSNNEAQKALVDKLIDVQQN